MVGHGKKINSMIAIINYGSGNVQAIANIYNKLNIENIITNDEIIIEKASKLILPGVGAFDEVMNQLNLSGLKGILNKEVIEKNKPVLGVCVGMQILGHKSEEGEALGLGWIDGEVKKMSIENLKHKPYLPHMGWNSVEVKKKNPIISNIDIEMGFYFLHSYHFVCKDPNDVLLSTHYGDIITSSVAHDNIFGMQFHPEKSHSNGIQIFKNFAEL